MFPKLARFRFAAQAAAIVLAVAWIYWPLQQAGFIWDDDAHVTRNATLRSTSGLGDIWLNPSATPQYYPLTHTSFWIQFHLGGLNPLPYHAANVLIHAANALLLWGLFRKMNIPGAWLAGMLFAVHPVQVESVAWITERKNVLSAFFYLISFHAWLRSGDGNFTRRLPYLLALAAFLAALFSKTVACTLPVLFVLHLWWKHGRVSAGDWIRMAPFFALGAAAAPVTIFLERNHVGALGPDWDLSMIDRILIASRALCFYVSKLAWPVDLMFVYPRWNVSPPDPTAWVWPLVVLAVGALLAHRQKAWGPAPAISALAFAVTLFPALGFFNIYPMRYSFVADHFQYLACAAPLCLASALWGTASKRLKPLALATGAFFLSLIILGFAIKARLQTGIYQSSRALWHDTAERNPSAWLAHTNMGVEAALQGDFEEAQRHYGDALRVRPGHPESLVGLAYIEQALKKPHEALASYDACIASNPRYAKGHAGRAILLWDLGRHPESLASTVTALQLGLEAEDISVILTRVASLDLPPSERVSNLTYLYHAANPSPAIGMSLAQTFMELNMSDKAIPILVTITKDLPSFYPACILLARLEREQGQMAEALEFATRAAKQEPLNPEPYRELARIHLAGSNPGPGAVANALKACELTSYRELDSLDLLTRSLAANNDYAGAIRTGERTLPLIEAVPGQDESTRDLQRRLILYRQGRRN